MHLLFCFRFCFSLLFSFLLLLLLPLLLSSLVLISTESLPSVSQILGRPDTTGYRFGCGLLHLLVELPRRTLKYDASGWVL